MTIFEDLWLRVEYYPVFNKYRKPSIWWFLLLLWCPFIHAFYDIKDSSFLDWDILELLQFIFIVVTTIIGLGPIISIIFAYFHIKHFKKFIQKLPK